MASPTRRENVLALHVSLSKSFPDRIAQHKSVEGATYLNISMAGFEATVLNLKEEATI